MDETRKCHVLLLFRELIPSIRLCGHCQMEELAEVGKIEYRSCQEKRVTLDDMNWSDVVLLGRMDSWYEYQLARKLKAAGKYLIYIIDDDLLSIPSTLSSAAYYGQKQIQRYIRRMLEASDAILSPSPRLLEKYAVDGRLGLLAEEPAVDPIEYERHDSSVPVKIGFAGSIDRTGDIENTLAEVLKRVKNEYGSRIQLEFFGAIPSFAKELGAKTIPYCDSYDSYRKTLNDLKWDIGLAPMPDTAFHACKHYNKFIEYAAAGCMTIHSAEEPYLRLDEFGCSVFAENNEENWYEQLCKAIDDVEYREDMRRKACVMAHTRLSCRKTAQELCERMTSCFLYRAPQREMRGNLLALKVGGYAARAIAKICTLRNREPRYIWEIAKRRIFRHR